MHSKVFEVHKERPVLVAFNEIQRGIGELVSVIITLLGRQSLGVLRREGVEIGPYPAGNSLVEPVLFGVSAQVCFAIVGRGITVFLKRLC